MNVSLIDGHIDDDTPEMTDNEMIERLNKGEGFDYDDIIDLINRQKAEIERLDDAVDAYKRECNKLSHLISKARVEAVNEFWAELKSLNTMDERIVSVASGDNLLKEMERES